MSGPATVFGRDGGKLNPDSNLSPANSRISLRFAANPPAGSPDRLRSLLMELRAGQSRDPGLWLAGSGAWSASSRAGSLVEALRLRGVTRLVDVRHGPCSSDPTEGRPYGPKPWNLRADGSGLVGLLAGAEIAYEWMVELGNPQRRDPLMAVLRSHLADPSAGWPVHRGLGLLADRVRSPGQAVAILCACGDHRTCHRLVIGRALADRHFGGSLTLLDLKTGSTIPGPPIMPG
jgi:hypothetical protein